MEKDWHISIFRWCCQNWMQGNPSYKQKTLALLATYGGTVLQWRDSSGKTDASSPRSAGFARGGLTVRPRKAKPWKRHPGFS
ncbi:hypothetical protein HUG20_17725 [Salicibibacter cibi]|uniref:Uncharacterized protein n=2 Tax=Salicibibacter cibi TaxID=2743001 RepID=A0A7T7CH01_9BACI|nr:hypothetical protein [Salicibibacter cibi]QQK81569.1 hypothetical protein HUG20_17725 [Salicibibacter cibi]